MSAPTTDEVKAAYKAGAVSYTMSGTYVTQPMMEQDFDNWLRGVQNEARGECVCEPYWPGSDGPSEDCPQHGREYSYWVEGCTTLNERIQTALLGHRTEDGKTCRCDGEGWPCTTYKILTGREA